MLPEPGEHSPTERQGQRRYQLTEALNAAEVGEFDVKPSDLKYREQCLYAPSQAIIRQCSLRAAVSSQECIPGPQDSP